MSDSLNDRYELMVSAARSAGDAAMQWFDRGVAVETKSDESPVTIADRTAEKLLRERITAAFPDDGFIGEEFGTTPGTSGYRWIIDPIDGTRCFIRGIPHWATLVGLEHQGRIVAGTAYEPAVGDLYRAKSGGGAFRNDRPIRVSQIAPLNATLGCYSGFQFFRKAGRQQTFLDFQNAVDRSRGYGDYYGFLLVARGSVDLMVDIGVHIWDIAALKPIVEEAGGVFTDWSGGADLERPDCVATNGRVHAEILQVLAKNPGP